MDFYDDPQAEKLNTVNEYLKMWVWCQRETRSRHISPTYAVMMSVRSTKKHQSDLEEELKKQAKNPRRGLILDQPIKMTYVEKRMISDKVDAIINDPTKWTGHFRDKEVIVSFYLDKIANPRGCGQSEKRFSKVFRVPRWKVKSMVRMALLYIANFLGVDDEKTMERY